MRRGPISDGICQGLINNNITGPVLFLVQTIQLLSYPTEYVLRSYEFISEKSVCLLKI